MFPKSIRIVLTLAMFMASYVLCWLLLLISSLGVLGGAANLMALIVALCVASRIWPKTQTWPQSLLGWTLAGSLLLGLIGFVAGYFGPMLLAPDAPQGPLLGVFVTGPMSLV
ncbi:hypothetical protein [Methylophaga sp. OBS3]|uniref:hypothetical protein n=1 Tax=Methylophaga sp. OBS3 TaxID=2991934 RepID=UPI002258C5A4|nr:hypothetical protein [Methylophaga sp. OBS3]MCX4189771.1 hypothetical protein [Methylophaga sp. OBS3]